MIVPKTKPLPAAFALAAVIVLGEVIYLAGQDGGAKNQQLITADTPMPSEKAFISHKALEVSKHKPSAPKTEKTSSSEPKAYVHASRTATKKPKANKSKSQKVKSDASIHYYKNCTELRKDYPHGVSSGSSAYRSALDRNKNGTACE